MYSATTISYIVSTIWLFSVALEVTVNCEKHDYDHDHHHGHGNHEDEYFRHDQIRGDLDRRYNSDRYRDYDHDRVYPRDDYHQHQSERLHENDRYDRRASAYDSRPSYDRRPVYQDPLYHTPQHNNNNYHHSGPSYYHDDHLKHKNSSPHYSNHGASNPKVNLLKATAGNMLKEELNRSLNRGLQHAIHDAKHQLSPETRNTIRNLKNELIHNNPNAKAKRFSKRVDSIVKHGSLLAKALK